MGGNAWFDGLPPSTQFVINIAVLIITAAGGAIGYIWRKKSPPEAKPFGGEFMLAGAQFADMNPVRELSRALDRLTTECKRVADATEAAAMQQTRTADALSDIFEVMEDHAKHAALAREVAQQFADLKAEFRERNRT